MKQEVHKGTVLLAQPFMLDPGFKRATLLVCEHNAEGSIGFVFNKVINMKLNDLMANFPEFDTNVYFGGPVQTDTIHYLHNVGDLLDDSVPVCKGIWWGGDFEKLKFLVNSKLILPSNIRFFVGYSGWSEGQLDEELKSGSWITAEMHPNYLFKTDSQKLWKTVMQNKGDKYTVIAQMPDYPNWN